MVTVSGTFCSGPAAPPSPRYSVATFVPLSATQAGVAGPCARPHGFTNDASVMSAVPGRSETRLCCTNLFGLVGGGWAPAGAAATRAVTTTVAAPTLTERTNLPCIGPSLLG